MGYRRFVPRFGSPGLASIFQRDGALRSGPWRGQSLVELSLIVTILTTMAFATVEFGRAFHAYNVVTHAARDGARAAMESERSNEEVEEIVEQAAAPLNLNHVYVDREEGATEARVTVRHDFNVILPLVSQFFDGGTITIERTMVSRVIQPGDENGD